MSMRLALTTLASCAALLTGCASGSGSPRQNAGNSGPNALSAQLADCATTPLVLGEAEGQTLKFMREEEKLARDVYQELAAFWGAQAGQVPVVVAMTRISQAEQQHMDALKALLVCGGLPDPVAAGEPRGLFLDPALAKLYTDLVTRGKLSQTEALLVGALIEEKDSFDLDEALRVPPPATLQQVYGNLRCGSRNHLRAFGGQLVQVNGSYPAQILPQATVDAIIATANEACGKL